MTYACGKENEAQRTTRACVLLSFPEHNRRYNLPTKLRSASPCTLRRTSSDLYGSSNINRYVYVGLSMTMCICRATQVVHISIRRLYDVLPSHLGYDTSTWRSSGRDSRWSFSPGRLPPPGPPANDGTCPVAILLLAQQPWCNSWHPKNIIPMMLQRFIVGSA